MPLLRVKSDQRAPPHANHFPITSDQHFDRTILFNVVKRSGNYVFEENPPPTAFRIMVVSFALGAYKVFIESVFAETSKRAHSIGKWLVFSIVESEW